MKLLKILFAIYLCVIALMVPGCRRSSCEVWDDTKSCGRHVNRGFKTLGGKQGDSRQVCDRNQFICCEEEPYSNGGYVSSEFTPLPEYSDEIAMGDFVNRQAFETPGDPNSSIPGIDAFRDPSTISEMRGIFRNINFPYNSDLVKGQQNIETTRNIANYLAKNPNVYVFIEGHCDQRGAEAYNLSLGARRANAIRNMLIAEGANPDHIFTISYGKERPLVHGDNEEAWSQNRRGEFKIYQR